DAGAHLDFLELDDLLVLARLGGLLLLLELVLSEIQDLADGRVCIGRNIHEIEAYVLRARQRIEFCNNPDVLTSLVDKLDFAGPDLVVNAGPGLFPALRLGSHGPTDGSTPSVV